MKPRAMAERFLVICAMVNGGATADDICNKVGLTQDSIHQDHRYMLTYVLSRGVHGKFLDAAVAALGDGDKAILKDFRFQCEKELDKWEATNPREVHPARLWLSRADL